VKSRSSGRSRTALMRELGTPEKPKPPTKIMDELFKSLIASWADGTILLMAGRETVMEKFRRHSGRNNEGPALAFIPEQMQLAGRIIELEEEHESDEKKKSL
jgi:hypothetical protein